MQPTYCTVWEYGSSPVMRCLQDDRNRVAFCQTTHTVRSAGTSSALLVDVPILPVRAEEMVRDDTRATVLFLGRVVGVVDDVPVATLVHPHERVLGVRAARHIGVRHVGVYGPYRTTYHTCTHTRTHTHTHTHTHTRIRSSDQRFESYEGSLLCTTPKTGKANLTIRVVWGLAAVYAQGGHNQGMPTPGLCCHANQAPHTV